MSYEPLRDEVESLRQQLAEARAAIDGLNGRFAKDQDRIACQAEQLAAALAACKMNSGDGNEDN